MSGTQKSRKARAGQGVGPFETCVSTLAAEQQMQTTQITHPSQRISQQEARHWAVQYAASAVRLTRAAAENDKATAFSLLRLAARHADRARTLGILAGGLA
jgi:hypothetical protein